MSNRWLAYVWKHSPYKDSTRFVHVALADRANDNGECWPSQKTLAAMVGCSLSSVEKALKQMCDDGYLTREKRGRRTVYRLLDLDDTRNPLRVTPVTRYGSDPSPITGPIRTISELSEEPTTSGPSGTGGGSMKSVGSLDDAEMPEDGASPRRRKERFERAPRENTKRRVVYEFERGLVAAGAGRSYLEGVMYRTAGDLYDEGYSYDEIVAMVHTFFTRYAPEVRAKRGEVDPAVMFRAKAAQLKMQVEGSVMAVRDGRKTSSERGREMGQDRLRRMRALTEGSTDGQA